MATTSLQGLRDFIAEIGLEPIPPFEAADILNKPVDIYHSYLAEHLQALVGCDPNLVYAAIQPSNTIENGDLDCVLPKLKLKIDGVEPKALASELLKKFQPHVLFQAPFKDGIHIRFLFATKMIPRVLFPYINDRKTTYGNFPSRGRRAESESESGQKKVIVEFSSPNIAREFTAAHLRSTILGAFFANMHEAMGWTVTRINYFGDWGKNLGLLGVGWQKYGSAEILEDPSGLFRYIHELYSKMEDELRPEQEARKQARDDGQDASVIESQGLFAERDAYFKRMEDSEPEAIALWEKFRAISIDYYAERYAQLNIKFDEYSGESQVSLNSEAVTEVESLLKQKGICEEQNGALVIDFDTHGGKGTAALRDRNGSTTYLLRDIATVLERLKSHAFDKMVYVVCEQDVHFRQVIRAVELMGLGDVASKLYHLTFTRTNTGLTPQLETTSPLLLGDILDHCEKTMQTAILASPDQYAYQSGEGDATAMAKAMGTNSMILHDLSLSLRKGHSNGLDFNLLTLSEAETGTGLQLCYARLCAALAAMGTSPCPEEIPHIDFAAFSEPPWSEILRLLVRYPDATESAFEKLDPGPVLSYLFRLAEEVTCCLDETNDGESEGAGGESSTAALQYAARAVLYESVRQVLENGMRLLGAIPLGR